MREYIAHLPGAPMVVLPVVVHIRLPVELHLPAPNLLGFTQLPIVRRVVDDLPFLWEEVLAAERHRRGSRVPKRYARSGVSVYVRNHRCCRKHPAEEEDPRIIRYPSKPPLQARLSESSAGIRFSVFGRSTGNT
jgi:hypothetical protein